MILKVRIVDDSGVERYQDQAAPGGGNRGPELKEIQTLHCKCDVALPYHARFCVSYGSILKAAWREPQCIRGL